MRLSFDKKAKDWDDNRRIQRSKVIAEKIIDYVNLQENFSGLEFGCGTGLISLNLYDKLDKITCIDTSSGMIKQLEDKVAEHNLDKEDGSFHSQESNFLGHNGFEQKELSQLLEQVGFNNIMSETFYNDERSIGNRNIEYSLFIMKAQK